MWSRRRVNFDLFIWTYCLQGISYEDHRSRCVRQWLTVREITKWCMELPQMFSSSMWREFFLIIDCKQFCCWKSAGNSQTINSALWTVRVSGDGCKSSYIWNYLWLLWCFNSSNFTSFETLFYYFLSTGCNSFRFIIDSYKRGLVPDVQGGKTNVSARKTCVLIDMVLLGAVHASC